MQMVIFLPFGGVGVLREADSTSPLASELGGLMMLGNLMKVTTVSTTRISAAATVQPISRRVLPWIWAATGLRLARKRHTE
jgi:hypothetical protein